MLGCQSRIGTMGKKKSKPTTEAPSSEPFHQAFSGLASLRAEQPPSDWSDSSSEPKPDSPPSTPTTSVKLVLQREKKGRAGKTATRLRGLPTPDSRLHWATKLKKELGCGATIEGEDVLLLGDVGERAKTRLEAGGFRRVVLGN